MPDQKRASQRKSGSPSRSHNRARPDLKVINDRLAALEQRLTRLESAFDTNTSVFSDGIKMLEIQQGVIRRILDDVVCGRTRTTADDGKPRRLDFESYFQEYLKGLVAVEEAGAKKEEPLITAPDDGPVVREFGGDV